MESVMSTHSPRRSRRFGEYELLDKIGQGGMSSVYKARHTVTGEIVALKIASRAVITT
jgi:serine/threonine protein kinase